MSEEDTVVVANVDGWLVTARKHLDSGELDDAEEIFQRVRQGRSDRWEGHMGVASVRMLKGDLAAVLQVLPDAIRADPECMPAYLLMGQIGVGGGVSDIAVSWLEHGAQHMPRQPVLFEWLICLYALEGRLDDLEGCLQHYAALREIPVTEAAMIFARDPRITDDVRRRITRVAGFK